MAIRVELPKAILTVALEQALSLRARQIKQASNELIKKALEDEVAVITTAKNTLTEIK